MIADVQAALDDVLADVANLRHASGAGRIFELFVMTGVACALKARGYDVWLQRSDGTRISPGDADTRFIQRGGSPSGVAAASAGPDNATSIGFRRRHWPDWEIWNGVQFRGRSSAKHEIDLAIVPGAVGRALRARPTGGIPLGRPRIAIECKDVVKAGSVDEMRALVARLYDVTLLLSHHGYLGVAAGPQAIHPGSPAGSRHRPVLTYWQENRRTMNVIARRSGFSKGASELTAYHSIEPHEGITAGSTNAATLFDGVADWLFAHGY